MSEDKEIEITLKLLTWITDVGEDVPLEEIGVDMEGVPKEIFSCKDAAIFIKKDMVDKLGLEYK